VSDDDCKYLPVNPYLTIQLTTSASINKRTNDQIPLADDTVHARWNEQQSHWTDGPMEAGVARSVEN
jgi:hypothetical protein